ncbi:MAG: lamin tail domain-containing protein [Myxococcales bacterium]|nr:lamin tail domain-containing protein [Myxococcales bacterium]
MKFLSRPSLAVSLIKNPAALPGYASGFFRTIRLKFGWPKIPLKNTTHLVFGLVWIAVFGLCSPVVAKCLTPAADITDDGMTTVTDIQCGILLAVAYLTSDDPPLPGCLQVPLADADLNCDGVVNVTDIQISINFVLVIPLDSALDKDNNQCVDFCEVDSDGDGTADAADCVPNNTAIYVGAPEMCNGWDDDCDGFIDEVGQGSTSLSCQDTTVCNGKETCTPLPANLGPTITEIFVDPAVPDIQWFEIWNPNPQKLNLAGYLLEDGQGTKHTINNSGPLFVRGGGHIVLGTLAAAVSDSGPYVNYTYSGISLATPPKVVILRNAAGTEIDRVEFDGPQFPQAPTAPIGLVDPSANNNIGDLWSETPGTPGGPNADIFDMQLCVAGIPLTCVDDVDCTMDGCDDETGCSFAPLDAICSDQDLCNGSEVCDPKVGCTAGIALSCDDGDECTEDQCLPTSGCVHGPKTGPSCVQLPQGAVCALTGTSGQTVDCVLRAVRESKQTPPMVGLQFALTFDAAIMQPSGFVDDFCTMIAGSEVCSTVDVPPGSLYPSGHDLLFFPKTISGWNGAGSVVVLNLSDPESPVTNGYIGAGKTVGDSAFITLRVQLKTDVPKDSPVYVYAVDVKGSTSKAEKLSGNVKDGIMVLGLPSCTGSA